MLIKLDKEIEQLTIAQAEERIKIDSLLNHYEPELATRIQEAPITRDQLESTLSPRLGQFEWQQEGRLWCKPDRQITFDPGLFDQTGLRAELVTPMSSISGLFGNLPPLPESWVEEHRSVTRLEMEGVTGFVVETPRGFYLSERIGGLQEPKGQRFNSVDDARMGLSHKLKKRKKEFLQNQLQVWKNRSQNWRIRVEMYCDRIAQWFWRSEGGQLDKILNIEEKWTSYTSHPDRMSLAQLIQMIEYAPNFAASKPKRGRVSKKSPRDGKKEGQLMDESVRIDKRIEILAQQLKA